MDHGLKKKLIEEQPLTVDEALRLDEAIEGQTAVSRLVAGLEDPAPSLAWRSELNQKLLAQSPKPKRAVAFRWVSGLAVASVLIGVAVLSSPRRQDPAPTVRSTPVTTVANGPTVEERLLTAHKEADLESGMGISLEDTSNVNPGSL